MIFGREPAAIVGAIQAALALALSFGWLSFLGLTTQDDLAALMLVLNAGAALYLAFYTSETLLAPVIEFFKAILGLAAIYNLHLSTDQTVMVIGFITAAFAAYQRRNVSPLRKGTLKYIAPDDVLTPQAA